MIKIAVCDDEIDIIKVLLSIISNYQSVKEIEIEMHSFSCGEELLKCEISFDLIFLDIEMGGIDGIDTAKTLRQRDRKVKIVYVTSHSEYSLKTYAVHPFDYAVKPVSEGRIVEILDEFIKYAIADTEDEPMIELKAIDGTLMLELKDIYVFEYIENRRITVHTKEKEFEIKGGITEILELLDKKYFTSPHRSFIINMEYVKSLNDFTIFMTNDVEIPVAQKKLREFKHEFSSFMKNYIIQR